MVQKINIKTRRTSVESVFDHLYKEIVSMRILPGTKISEAEIASLFNVSRQPVRDAFSKLENHGLLLIRPQKATEVKGFSSSTITTARFVRASLEAEVLRRAARSCNESGASVLQEHLTKQRKAVDENNASQFRLLDYDFHRTLCSVAEVDFAFNVIAQEKAKVDRLCVLGLTFNERIEQLLEDHISIADRVSNNDDTGAVKAGMLHLSRLDATIDAIRIEHAEYFND